MIFQLFVFSNSFLQNIFSRSGHRTADSHKSFQINSDSTRLSFEDEGWKNIRVKYDFDYLTGVKRHKDSCYEVGQIVDGKECKKENLVQNYNYTNFNKTLKNLKNFLESFLFVIPDENNDFDLKISINILELTLLSYERFVFTDVKKWYNYSRPTEISIIIYGEVFREYFLNPESGLYQNNAVAMKIMLQAILHELVINLGSKYDGRQFCRMTKYGREFTILTTKYAHIFAKKHYGVDVFEGDDKNCPSGIEVDAESDYSRTIDKRLLRTRLFYSDIGTYNFLD